ncbi:ComEC/Rec2 family competence protein [Lutibacter sp. B1]|uniref:ComEC/Rec2 family competence protein n=1 Tax=Lutibacter sp. B1 TaxID=2725996 RepID=UPI001457007B|nr:ComEC/Rec2 family competence protein [Lutibacter sp. B1]NLP58896.1 ComEC family competence protein [Lutibacter sp. B1]
MIKLVRFVPIQLTFLLITGILIGFYFPIPPIYLVQIYGAFIVFFGVIYFRSNKQFNPSYLFSVTALVFSVLIGIGAITFKNQLNNKKHYANYHLFSKTDAVNSIILIKKELKPTLFHHKYEGKVLQFENEKTIGKIIVNIEKDSLQSLITVGDRILAKAAFIEIKRPANPYSFNYKQYLENQQIHHQIVLKKGYFLKLMPSKTSINLIAEKFRNKVNVALKNNGFTANELAVVNALLLGQRQQITDDLMESYVDAGAIHILAVSGLHIGIILLFLTFIFKPFHYFKNGKLIASLLIILFLWMYAIIAGLSASVVRAVTMFTAVAIGMYLNKPSNIYNTLFISMFFLLLFNPYYLFEVGFQLSYLAVFSIVWIQPKLYNLWSSKFWLIDKFWQLFTVSIAAQIGILPLSLYYFHQFPGLFFLSNLMIIPFLGLILIAGIITILLALLHILPQFLSESYIFVIQKMNNFVSWISNQEQFVIQYISFSFLLMIAVYLFVFVVLKWFEKRLFYRIIWVLISILIIQFVLIYEKYKLQSTNEFIVFNKNKQSIIASRSGDKLTIYSSIDSLKRDENPIKSYIIGSGIGKNFNIGKEENVYKFNKEIILVIDSLGIYNLKSIQPTVILLQQSPKINLERLLKLHNPKLVIADGSNYKSYINRWKQSCIKNKTPFYSTMQKGAYIFE